MSEPAPQMRVVEYYKNKDGWKAATVGEYVRVETATGAAKTCMGPMEDKKQFNWTVVEIDWEHNGFLLAPNTDQFTHRLADAEPAQVDE